MPRDVSLHDTYPYDEVLADAVDAITIAQALHRESERLRREFHRAMQTSNAYWDELQGCREALVAYRERGDTWQRYATALDAYLDGEGTTRPQRQAYGL